MSDPRRGAGKWGVNPRGWTYCKAPVPGGCDRQRASKYSHGLKAFCHAHDKRQTRGRDLTTPICEEQSSIVLDGLRRWGSD